MTENAGKPAPGRPRIPLLDALGELCFKGRDLAVYLWQVPDDQAVRQQLGALLVTMREEIAKSGRREMRVIVEDLDTALKASPSPQQIEILQDGFDRITKLWQSAKSGLM